MERDPVRRRPQGERRRVGKKSMGRQGNAFFRSFMARAEERPRSRKRRRILRTKSRSRFLPGKERGTFRRGKSAAWRIAEAGARPRRMVRVRSCAEGSPGRMVEAAPVRRRGRRAVIFLLRQVKKGAFGGREQGKRGRLRPSGERPCAEGAPDRAGRVPMRKRVVRGRGGERAAES